MLQVFKLSGAEENISEEKHPRLFVNCRKDLTFAIA